MPWGTRLGGSTSNGTYGQTTVPASPTAAVQVRAANATRAACSLVNNNSAGVMYVGKDSSVTTSTGTPVMPGGAYVEDALTGPYTGALYAVGSVAIDCRWEENG